MPNEAECIEKYNRELYRQQNPYETWIEECESCSITELTNNEAADTDEQPGNIVLLWLEGGICADNANDIVKQEFEARGEVSFLYGDEDVVDADGRRHSPWFKPEVSPATIESVNYVGSIFAVRKDVVVDYIRNHGTGKLFAEYDSNDNTAEVIRLQVKRQDLGEYWAFIKNIFNKYNGAGISKILYHGYAEEVITQNIVHNIYKCSSEAMISIIIPSKDNPIMLQAAISSIIESADMQYEIIVIDNGSCEENKAEITKMAETMPFKYIYNKSEFNFSKMCNEGAKNSVGNILMFLNDDVTVTRNHWMSIMAGEAMREKTGAVGAKLYYPGSTVIQHTGITNMGIGPAHKLGGMDDEGGRSLYHGLNLCDRNVIAVTAAALAVRKSLFEEIGGFNEDLKVAYNDVELGFKLCRAGYNNIVRNDCIMYHHESISRGNDESGEKYNRLLKERRLLYELYPEYCGYDPYYSRNLVQYEADADYNTNIIYDFNDLQLVSRINTVHNLKDNSYNLLLKLRHKLPKAVCCIDSVKMVAGISNDGLVGWIEGWSLLTEDMECLYDRQLVLLDENGNGYAVQTFPRLREDAAAAVQSQRYGMLAGYVCHISPGDIPGGEYRVGIRYVSLVNEREYVIINNEFRILKDECEMKIKHLA